METSLHSLLLDCARGAGFPLAGALDLDRAAEAVAPHISRYDRWISEGNAGAMQYLERGRDRRADPRLVFPAARSILCVAIPYPKRPGGAPAPDQGPRYARYIHGRDYHEEIAARLEQVMKEVAARSGLGEALQWKVCVDTSAVLERSWAALAGLGWIGKNTLLIHPQLGSYLFLGEVLINQATGKGPNPLPDYCGNCTRCLQACPTRAIREPHWVDSRRCISYWTLEKRGALELAEDDKRAIGPWIAGCDLCQEVCPFNTKPVKQELGEPEPPRDPAAAEFVREWEALLREDPAAYKARVGSSALSRVKPAQFSRNLAITLANSLLETAVSASPLLPLIEKRLAAESDEAARAEWVRCFEAAKRS
jgi:epoxyqueuosine reductase